MKQTHVVTVFLWHKNKVCLVRRSQKVSTYQGCWSGISGYLEGDPLDHFKVELQEETSLIPYEYRLVRKIDPVEIVDEKYDKSWIVHPFVCEVFDPSRIVLDWENSELQWYDPEEISSLKTVPGLWDVFYSVSRLRIEEHIRGFTRNLKEDKNNGARELAVKGLEFLVDLCSLTNAASTETLISDILFACDKISNVRPSMAIISTTCKFLKKDLSRIDKKTDDVSALIISGIITDHIEAMNRSTEQAAGHVRDIIPDGSRVFLHSYSSSILRTMQTLFEKSCSVVVTESRPGMEGRQTARIAGKMGLMTRLTTDACAANELKDADIVLLGSDSIEEDGSVINKAGSALIAMTAHAMGIKVYFLGEIRKISLKGKPVELEEHETDEVWDDPPSGISVGNVYFDRTPPRYITGIILEQGIVDPYQIMKISRHLGSKGFTKDSDSV